MADTIEDINSMTKNDNQSSLHILIIVIDLLIFCFINVNAYSRNVSYIFLRIDKTKHCNVNSPHLHDIGTLTILFLE